MDEDIVETCIVRKEGDNLSSKVIIENFKIAADGQSPKIKGAIGIVSVAKSVDVTTNGIDEVYEVEVSGRDKGVGNENITT